jgi:hypothetical protein
MPSGLVNEDEPSVVEKLSNACNVTSGCYWDLNQLRKSREGYRGAIWRLFGNEFQSRKVEPTSPKRVFLSLADSDVEPFIDNAIPEFEPLGALPLFPCGISNIDYWKAITFRFPVFLDHLNRSLSTWAAVVKWPSKLTNKPVPKMLWIAIGAPSVGQSASRPYPAGNGHNGQLKRARLSR